MNHKPLFKRLGACFASFCVAVSAVFLFSLSPVSVSAESTGLWDDDMNAWIDVAQDLTLSYIESDPVNNASGITWYVSLQMIQDILNDNDYMITAGQFDDLQCGYGHFFDNENHYQTCMFPLDFDTNTRYERLLLAHTSVGDIFLNISNTGDSNSNTYLSYSRVVGMGLHVIAYYGTSSPPITVTIEGDSTGYFTNTSAWVRSFEWYNPWSSSYDVFLTQSSRVENVYPNYTPYITANYMQFGDLCGQYSAINMSDLNISDIAISQLYEPATLHDFIVDDWLPGFESSTGITLSAPPDPTQDPSEPTEDSGSGCNCHCEVNVEVNVDPTVDLPPDWTDDLVDLTTEHYTAPYEDMVISPWDDLQSAYAPEPSAPVRSYTRRAGEDVETDDYHFVSFIWAETIKDVIDDYQVTADYLFRDSGIRAVVAGVLSAGLVIRFVSLK